MELKVRNGRLEDVEACFILEEKTFPKEEAASKKNIEIRLKIFPQGFIVGELDGEIVAHINSGSINKNDITDEEFKELIGHEECGKNIVIFSVAVDPIFQNKGFAKVMMKNFIEISKKINKEKILLLCKENLVEMYKKMGYKKVGVSASTHGGAVWYEMEQVL